MSTYWHEAYIVRPDHPWNIADGDLERFAHALQVWLRDRDDAQCLTCARTFKHHEPAAFFLIEFNVQQGTPQQIVLSGVCRECAARTDAELRREGIRGFFGDGVTVTEFIDPGHGGTH